MKLHKVMAVTLACAAPLLLAACGGGDSEGVTGTSSGPRFPSVSGTWQGAWIHLAGGHASGATLELRQDGDRVWGTLTVDVVGREVNEVSGRVSEFGVLRFEGQASHGCTTYSSESPHLVLEERNTTLDGPVARSSPSLGSCGSEPLRLEDGILDLKKMG